MSAVDRVFDKIERAADWCIDNPKSFGAIVAVLVGFGAWGFSMLSTEQQSAVLMGFLIGMLIGSSGSRMGGMR